MLTTDFGLEINATRSCTNACVACNHSSTLFTAKYFMEPAVLARDLDVMKNHLRVKLMMIQGGEPLLHPKVVELMEIMAQSKIGSWCGVLTNGKLLPRMKEDFWLKLGEYKMELRMSCYPDLDPEIVPFATAQSEKYGFSIRPQTINAFMPLFRKVPDGSTYYGCPWNRCLTCHEGWFYLCPLTAFFPKQYMNLPEHIDGIPIPGMTDDRLSKFLSRDKPLETCKICAGATGPAIPWHQNKNKEEWEKEAGLHEALAV